MSSHVTGVAKAKGENYVYMGEKSGVTILTREDCNFVIGRQEFFPSTFAFVLPEDSLYLPYFNDV